MTDGIHRRVAAGIVEDALAAVFDPDVVRQLREDSPLSVLGMSDADAVCVSDAVRDAARAADLDCTLGDTELGAARTVAELVDAVREGARRRVEAGG